MNLKKRYMITTLSGAVIMIAGILLSAFTSLSDKIYESGIITMGMVMIVIGVVYMIKKREGVVKDELTRKIADRAAAYSWLITLLTLLVVFWLNHFELIEFTVNAVITITYVVMVATMVVFQRVFWLRGDVK